MKWLNIYLQWPWQQKWVQQLQGERWRTGLNEGLNTKQLDFFTDSYWVTLTWCSFCLRGDILNLDEGGEGVEALPLSHLVHHLILLLLKMSGQCHHIFTVIYPQLQYQRVVVGVVVVVVQLVIIQLVPMAKTQLVTIGGRSCWVIADTSISGRLELDFQF